MGNSMLKLLIQIFTEKGLYISTGVIGFISGIVGIFIDVNSEISVKWLLFVISISLIVVIVLLSLLSKFIWEKPIINQIKIIKYYSDRQAIVLKTNQDISINSLLSIYINNDGYEELQAICYIENIQENKLLSAKIIKNFVAIDSELIKKSIIKTTLPLIAIRGEESE